MSNLQTLHTTTQVPSDGPAVPVRAFPPPSISAFGTIVAGSETAVVELQFPYGILTEHVNLSGANGGYISSSMGMAIVNTGTGSNGYASLESKTANHYVSGMGGRTKFAGYFVSGGLPSSTQEIGIGDDSDGFFFGYSGSLFGVNRRARGVDNWALQTQWNRDRMDGTGASGQTLDPTKGNVYFISYQWLGFGAITYHVEDSQSGMFYPVHRIGYANTYLTPSIADPNLPVRMAVRNWGSTGSVAVNVSSIGAMIEGIEPAHGIRRGDHDLVTAVSSEVCVISVLNSASFNGRQNRMRVKVDSLSVASRDANGQTTFRLVMNATLTGSSFSPVSSSASPISVDKAATTFSGGREIMFIGVGPNGSQVVDLSRYNIRLAPNELLTLTASGSNSTVVGGLSWLEEL